MNWPHSPTVVRVSLQTNGVLLDEQWLNLFDSLYPRLQIGISLDGDARGNAWRVGYDGKPVYPRVTDALRLLGSRGRKVGVIAAVTPAVLGRAEAVLDRPPCTPRGRFSGNLHRPLVITEDSSASSTPPRS
ncbi:hypothetical protein ACFC08_38920 [Streptomyces sp. NPDC056112]|uniref:hypothetical protein n=1 Tax=unclassified Streptomyces TaxID=2593676 RepID=UPI0011426BA9|nr:MULTISPECIES: hypothetical protein [unclassified Streptomyces]GED88615.1 hypothetical protein TNCT6_57000 [Streptomyces sp. 6-11-2]